MGHKQQAVGAAGVFLAKAPIVKSRDHRLARAGGRYHQVVGKSAYLTLGVQLVQDFLLVGVGVDVEQHIPGMVIPLSPLSFQGAEQPVVFPLLVELKFRRVPVAVKGG